MDLPKPEESHFAYDRSNVRLCYQLEGELHVVAIFISDQLVNRNLFFSLEDAQNAMHNLELALTLGAKFNDEGYWGFDLPPEEKSMACDEYYRRAK